MSFATGEPESDEEWEEYDKGYREAMNAPTPDTSPQDSVNLCKSCGTMKHLNGNGLCGRCADTSPGDELEAILLEVQKNTDAWWNTPQPEYKGKHPAIIRAEAKDRLNRLMLTRTRAELLSVKAKLLVDQDAMIPNATIRVIFNKSLADIDAQLNKEETDGDVPTHSEASKP